jgi:hypothetical protein
MWFKFRIALICLSFLMAWLIPDQHLDELRSMPGWMLAATGVICLLFVATTPLFILFLIGIQSRNPLSKRTWRKPDMQANPFNFGNPLQFFHFAAYLLGACAFGVLISSPWRGRYFVAEGMFLAMESLMILAGVRLSLRVYKHKFAGDNR